MSSLRNAIPVLCMVLSACNQQAEQAGSAAPSAASAVAKPVRAADARLLSTRAFQCAIGGRFELRDYDDGTTRVEIKSRLHVLRPVNVGSGGLLQGDNISVRLFDDQATASENGVVLNSGCKVLKP